MLQLHTFLSRHLTALGCLGLALVALAIMALTIWAVLQYPPFTPLDTTP